jgi:integrase
VAKRRERGDGGLFLMRGSKNYYAQIYINGKPHRISTRCSIKEEAKNFLKNLMLDKTAGKPFIGDVQKVTYADLRSGLMANYTEKGNKSLLVNSDGEEFINGLNALDSFFGYPDTPAPVTKISTDAAREFVRQRLADGVSNSTVNGSLRLLRRMLKLAYEDRKIPMMPVIRLLKENPARKGFLDQKKFDELIKRLPLHLRALVTFLYWCGVRLGEAQQIEWQQVDLKAALIRLEDEQTKSGEPRVIPLPGVLVKMLETMKNKQGKVFDSTNCRKEWAKACSAVGLGKLQPVDKNGNQRYTGLIIHDLRRSAVRNLRKAGIPESVVMKISGHKTRTVFERYNIVDTEDLTAAMRRAEQQANLKSISESSVRVIPQKSSRKRLTA